MTTNVQSTRSSNRPGEPAVVEPTPTPVVTPTGVGGVTVYDRDAARTTDPSLPPSASMTDDPIPAEPRPTSSILNWIIGAILLIVLAYFLLQIIF